MSDRRKYKTFTLAVSLAALLAITAMPGAANAKYRPVVGVGDNGPAMFNDPNFQALGTKISRKIIPWDFYGSQFEIDQLNAWLFNAKTQGVEPLIAFERSRVKQRHLPSVKEFEATIAYFRANYPEVISISPWNEINHSSQPTARNPKRAAEYYNVVTRACPQCKIVAADVLDQPGFISYLKKFKRSAKVKPKIWGLHSYKDANRKTNYNKSATAQLLKAVKGKVWLTEVGGIVAFARSFPFNEARAGKAITKTLDFSTKSKRIERVYLYSWFGTIHKGGAPYLWDSGIVGPNGAPRPSYTALRKWLKR